MLRNLLSTIQNDDGHYLLYSQYYLTLIDLGPTQYIVDQHLVQQYIESVIWQFDLIFCKRGLLYMCIYIYILCKIIFI